MNKTLHGAVRRGHLRIPASKSQAHRLLICAALGSDKTIVRCGALSDDINATVRCLRALGADIGGGDGALIVHPIREVPGGECELFCGESGTTLRLLLGVVGALGARAVFFREGRLPERPLSPFDELLARSGMHLRSDGALLHCEGRLRGGDYEIVGNVSSQYVSSLLISLPLLQHESMLRVIGPLESAPYAAMTEQVLRLGGIRFQKKADRTFLPGAQRYALPSEVSVEGDWSNAAFYLCMGALSRKGICIDGLRRDSVQGDRAILDILRRFGAEVTAQGSAVCVRRGALRGIEIDASSVPDLVPAAAVLAAVAEGQTRITRAARLRLKESDRLAATARLITDLGGIAEEQPDGLSITGVPCLAGGSADAASDHRIAMAAALASCASRGDVTVRGAECVKKSYPAFWEHFEQLEEEGPWHSM